LATQPEKLIKFMDLKQQNRIVASEFKTALNQIFEESAFIGGSELTNFEFNFAKYCGVKHCLGVGNGTDALEIALSALELPYGSKVVVPANSFISTAEAVVNVGLVPAFASSDPDSHQICPISLGQLLEEGARAVIFVHLYGAAVNVAQYKPLLNRFNVATIEDCAQAHGAKIDGRMVGTLGDVGCYSFYPGKNLGAIGDAGALISDSHDIIERCRRIANHGRLGKFDHELLGRNSRLDNIQAAMLGLKLKFLDEWNNRRRSNARVYIENLSNFEPIQLSTTPNDESNVYHHFVVRTDRREGLRDFLGREGIETGIHYPSLIPRTPAFREYKYAGSDESSRVLSLPVAEHLGVKDIHYIIDKIRKFFF